MNYNKFGLYNEGLKDEDVISLTEKRFVNEKGDSMKGDLILNGHKIKELSFPINDSDAANKKYTDLTTTRIESSLTTKIDNIEQGFNDKFNKLQSLIISKHKEILPIGYKRFIEPSLITTNSKSWSVFMVVKIIDPYFFLFHDDNKTMKWFVKCDYNSKLKKGDVIIAAYALPHGSWYDKNHYARIYKTKSKNIDFKSTLVQYIDLIFYESRVDVPEVGKALRELYKDILTPQVSFDVRILIPDGAQKNKVFFF